MAEEWTSIGSATFGTGNGGVGSSCVNPQNCVISSSDAKLAITASAGWQITLSCSFAPALGASQEIFRLEDLIPNTCLSLFRRSSGKLQLSCPSGFGTIADTVVTIADNTYTAIDVGYFQSGTVGRIEVRVNGARIAALTSTVYTNGTAGTLASVNMGTFTPSQLRLVNAGQAITYDYIGVKQDTAAWSDTPTQVWPGIQLKGVLRPNGNGTYASGSQWANVGGGGNVTDLWLAIDEAVSDHDTSYNVYNGIPAAVTSDRMSVTMENAPSNMGTIAWVCHKQELRTSPGGVNGTVKLGCDTSSIGGGSLVETSAFACDTSQGWRVFQQNLDTAPGGATWTPALLNAAQSSTLAAALS